MSDWNNDSEDWWKNLIKIIKDAGGYIHPKLVLGYHDNDEPIYKTNCSTAAINCTKTKKRKRIEQQQQQLDHENEYTPTDNKNNNCMNRGIFCVAKGNSDNSITNERFDGGLEEKRNTRLFSASDEDNNNDIAILVGEILFRLPSTLAIHGSNFPITYYNNATASNDTTSNANETNTNNVRLASPWLRCLASYYNVLNLSNSNNSSKISNTNSINNFQANTVSSCTATNTQQDAGFISVVAPTTTSDALYFSPKAAEAYICSLPFSYETIWNWSTEEIDEFLAGTTPQVGQHHHNHSENTATTENQQRQEKHLECNTTVSLSSPWKVNHNDVKERYRNQIRPYLITTGVLPATTINDAINDSEIDVFINACQALSTRCFHLDNDYDVTVVVDRKTNNNNSNNSNVEENNSINTNNKLDNQHQEQNNYTGPFLLPLIDLINHTSDCTKKCTTLQRIVTLPSSETTMPTSSSSSSSSCHNTAVNENNCTTSSCCSNNNSDSNNKCSSYFLMVAERPIRYGEEIFHSYGDQLTSSQFLQTFGFVPETYMEDLLVVPVTTSSTAIGSVVETNIEKNNKNNHNATIRCRQNITPAMLSKKEILQSCWNIIESKIPEKLLHQIVVANNNNKKKTNDNDEDDDDDDEVWNVTNTIDRRQRTAEITETISDDIIIYYTNNTSNTHSSTNTTTESVPAPPPQSIDGNGQLSPILETTATAAVTTTTKCDTTLYVPMLSDELVTLFSVPFLPMSALVLGKNHDNPNNDSTTSDDVHSSSLSNNHDNDNDDNTDNNDIIFTSGTLFDQSLLQDLFLGQLVYTAMLHMIDSKLASYKSIPQSTLQLLLTKDCYHRCCCCSCNWTTTTINNGGDNNSISTNCDHDRIILQYLLLWDKNQDDDENAENENCTNNNKNNAIIRNKRRRLMYGLTIRIEEKMCLYELRQEIQRVQQQQQLSLL